MRVFHLYQRGYVVLLSSIFYLMIDESHDPSQGFVIAILHNRALFSSHDRFEHLIRAWVIPLVIFKIDHEPHLFRRRHVVRERVIIQVVFNEKGGVPRILFRVCSHLVGRFQHVVIFL